MGLLIQQSVAGHRVLLIGEQTAVSESRRTKLESLGASVVLVPTIEAVSLDPPAIRHFLTTSGRPEVDGVVDSVFVGLPSQYQPTAVHIFDICQRLRIPVNVADQPTLCTFTLLSSYQDGDFQVGITTGGKGCRLASRLRRHITNSLPPGVGAICERVGQLRQLIHEEDEERLAAVGEHDDDAEQTSTLNSLVLEANAQSAEDRKKQRMRWLSQIVEYYPFERLVNLEPQELSRDYSHLEEGAPVASRHGRISLVGAGPGSEKLLTKWALDEIYTADVILADKLVPSEVLELIPKQTPVHIAKKFPGNAEKAQEELLQLGLDAVRRGQHVVRLKQGDPYIFGRGAEEYIFFRSHGYTPQVVAGITSALAAPLYANISATHRNVADQLLVCTGTGRGGALPDLPEWVESRTTVFLMALHRIGQVVDHLVAEKHWDPQVPCAVVERASCRDQRIIRTTLEHVAEAIAANGSRPPGLLVTGRSCGVIELLGEEKWVVEEGFR